jgi:hypothetical protein
VEVTQRRDYFRDAGRSAVEGLEPHHVNSTVWAASGKRDGPYEWDEDLDEVISDGVPLNGPGSPRAAMASLKPTSSPLTIPTGVFERAITIGFTPCPQNSICLHAE